MILIFWIALVPQGIFSQQAGMDAAGAAASPASETAAGRSAEEEAYVIGGGPAETAAAETSPADGTARRRVTEEAYAIGASGPAVQSGGAAFPVILRMVLVLALVAAFIYLAVFFLKRISRPSAEQNPHLKILATSHLGGGRFLHVVAVGKKAWLVGAGEGGISHIAGIEDQEALDAMILDASRKTAETLSGPIVSFKAMLRRFSSQQPPPPEDRLENIRQRRERFKRF